MNYLETLAWEIFVLSGESNCDTFEEEKPLWLSYAVLCLVIGEDVTNEDVHHAWSANEVVHGNAKHKSLIPFNELTEEVQALDEPYRDAIAKRAYLMTWERKEPQAYGYRATIIPGASTVTIF